MKDIVSRFSDADYIALLAPGSRAVVKAAFDQGVPLEQAATLLAAMPSAGLSTKGGSPWPADLWPRVREEMRVLLCTDDARYADVRRSLRAEGTVSASVVVNAASGAVGAFCGFGPALCVPLVAVLLAAGAKVGVEAWCAAMAPVPAPAPVPPGQGPA